MCASSSGLIIKGDEMIETDERGQHQLDELVKSRDEFKWTYWELSFLEKMVGKKYQFLTTKQKMVITEMYAKLTE